MKITLKLRLLVAGLIATLATVCGVALWESASTRSANEQSYQGETVATSVLADANSSLWALRWGVAQYLAMTDAGQRQKLLDADKGHYGEFERHMKAFFDQPLPQATRAAAIEVKENFDRYAAARVHWMELMGAGKADEAAALRAQTLTPAGAATVGAINKVIELERETAEANYQRRNANLASLSIGLLAGCILAIAAGAVVSYTLVRSLGRQLGGEPRDAASLAGSVAQGDLSVPIDVQPGDHISLMAQLQQMQSSLTKVVANVRQCSESVAVASERIALGNNDLSSRTAQQASALEETAASMEQLGSTVKQNADNARQANQLAQAASTVATRGGEVIGQVVDTMKGINESSKKIADIISVIDGIAFQTNILALNAAVEAARAGEQGRGFAVVAGEVRTLAQRSADAAREIKSLITASVQRVEQGSMLVDQAGSTMSEVVASIHRVTDIVSEISAASAEQSAGVAQVGDAISQMDTTTQQNAALVEESAASAENLKVQAQQLVQAVSVFKLAKGADGRPPAQDAAPEKAAAVPAAAPAKDRRGPNRPMNVVRLKPQAKAQAQADTPAAGRAAPAKTGTDDAWTEF